MNTKPSAPSADADLTAPDAAQIPGGVNTAIISTARKTEDLLDALKKNRGRLQALKNEYVAAVKSDGGVAKVPSGKRRTIYHEILRTYGSMESLKNELTQRGAAFDLDANDHEHPNAAFKRMTAPPTPPDHFEAMFWYIVASVTVLFLWLLFTS
jgi:hypothetical protein